jgi:hypothetical protein
MPSSGLARLLAALLLAAPTAAAAGDGEQAPTPPAWPRQPRMTFAEEPGGVEAGLGSTLVLIFPTVGGQLSVPTGRGLRAEASVHALPHLQLVVDDLVLMLQGQVRIPIAAGRGGHRRGLLIGVTAFTIGSAWDDDRYLRAALVRPHAGFTWQWQTSPIMDVRLDVHTVIMGTTAPGVAPFAGFSLVWHGERRRP